MFHTVEPHLHLMLNLQMVLPFFAPTNSINIACVKLSIIQIQGREA